MINKLADVGSNHVRYMKFYENARTAFISYMKTLNFTKDEHVLLPAYIGWSANEGSGVFDPIEALGVKYTFYALDKKLYIDLNCLKKIFKTKKIKLFVIIHYFGFVDPSYEEAVSLARKYDIKILEDEAHALYTDFVGGASGRLGDACIFSLHKMLPVNRGGMLCINNQRQTSLCQRNGIESITSPFCYDLFEISKKRLENTKIITDSLKNYTDIVRPLRTEIKRGEIPQTYPIIINKGSRDQLYELMNRSGFGVVSLYHTMIDQISKKEFPNSDFISKRILNLPVHQDADQEELKNMIGTLTQLISSY